MNFIKKVLCILGLGFLFKKPKLQQGSIAFVVEEYEEDENGLIITKARPTSISIIDPVDKPYPVSSLSEISFIDPNREGRGV